jgi:carboxyl-terminal processing protease
MAQSAPAPKSGVDLRQALSLLGFCCLVTVMSLLFFAGGYLFGNLDGRTDGPLTRSGILPGPTAMSAGERQQYSVLWEALQEIKERYYKSGGLDDQALARGAVSGLVQAVGDPYTVYLTPRARELSDEELRGSFDGIGVQVDLTNNQIRIIAPLVGSPAEKAGIKPNDVIVRVDGQDVTQLPPAEAVTKVRGPRGSSVTVTVRRGSEQLDFTMQRDVIRVASVNSKMLPESGVGYLQVTTFGENTGRQVQDQLRALLESKPSGIVLDLRHNPGGYLNAAVDVTSQFLRDSVVLYQERGSGTDRREYKTNGTAQAAGVPLAVLIDGGSASAAEIVAAALRENERAVLVGQKSFGKGTVQEIRNLSDSSQLRVTVAEWLTPHGRPLQGQGLLPDIEVTPVQGQDAPLAAAVTHLSGLAKHG